MNETSRSLEKLADEFEAIWATGTRPEIAEFLNRVESPQRALLATLLVPIDTGFRQRAGESIHVDDYAKFAGLNANLIEPWLRAVVAESAEIDPVKEPPARAVPVHSTDEQDLATEVPDIPAHYSALQPRRMIGPYKLLQRLGEGGMGEVWMAEQSHPVKRRVALKLIKAGTGSREVIARFEAERQALALMNHPNIARILDIGATEQGQPYFVMELVTGTPLTLYCDDNQLSIDERLELFTQVCAGVQHAHQKGIIHRDLKPGNIIVGIVDGLPVPKVIDFGLAKATESIQRLTDKSVFTEVGQILGTLKYMSPEQASLNNLDIDTRTDIYSLGIILYELLTGSTPLDSSSIKDQAIIKVLELIRDKEPVKPSSKLSTGTSEQVSAITNKRRTDQVRLNRLLQGDLDWIVMKALETDRSRRYESASGFAADIGRYLSGDAVTARPPSWNYRVRKFVRKNRAGVLAAGLIALALIGGIIGTSIGMMEAHRQTVIARSETEAKDTALLEEARQRAEAERQRKEADKQRSDAERHLAFARKGNEILSSVFANLDPRAEYTTVADLRNALRDNLKDAVRQLEGTAIGEPLEVASLQNQLGLSLLNLGDHSQAISLHTKALETREQKLGRDHQDTLTSMGNLAIGYQSAGQLDKAIPLFEETAEIMRVQLGPDHPDTLKSKNNLAGVYKLAGQLDKALPLNVEALEMRKSILGPDHPDTLASMNNLAAAYASSGQLDKALPLYKKTLEMTKAKLGPDHPETVMCMNNLAECYRSLGQLHKALPLHEETLKRLTASLGPDHPNTLTSMNNLAVTYQSAGQLDKALLLHEEVLKMRKASLGPDHHQTNTSMNNLASAYKLAGQLNKALPLFEETLRLAKAKFGPDHRNTLVSMNNLAMGYQSAGQLDKALPLHEETLKIMKAKLGPHDPNTLSSMGNLARVYQFSGQLDKALPLFEETLKLRNAKLGPDHPDTLTSMGSLAKVYDAHGQIEKSLLLFEQVSSAIEKQKFQHQFVVGIVNDTILGYEKTKRLDDADRWHGKLLEHFKNEKGAESNEYANQLALLGLSLIKRNEWIRAEAVLRECYAIRQKTQPEAWTTFNTQSTLGEALLAQKKYDDAEPLLVQGYEGLNSREASIPTESKVRVVESLDRLIDLYTALEKPDEIQQYQELRAKYPPPTTPPDQQK